MTRSSPHSPLRVAVVYNLKRASSTPDGAVDADAEYDSAETIERIVTTLRLLGHEPLALEADSEFVSRIQSSNVDVVLNLAEGRRGRSREAQVPAVLEMLGIPYTGADPTTLGLVHDKSLAKRVVRDAGVPTPDFALHRAAGQPLPASLDGHWPLFVKPVAEGSSKGIHKKSVVHTRAELDATVAWVVARYGQPALVEAYLPGREFTVGLVAEGDDVCVLPILEIAYKPSAGTTPAYLFEHKLKFHADTEPRLPAPVSEQERREIVGVARAAWDALGCRDLARIDLRCDGLGRVNFMECNPLPGLAQGWSDFARQSEALGWDYRELLSRVLAGALRRREEANPRMTTSGRSGSP